MELRKFNTIEHYFDRDSSNSLLPGSTQERLQPMSNIQTVLYANFKNAEPSNIMEVTFSANIGNDRVSLERRPMYYVGKVTFNGEEFHRWEFLVTDDISYIARPDRETTLYMQYTEREISDFIGIFENYGDVENIDYAENGDVVYVLDDNSNPTYPANEYGSQPYQYVDPSGWVPYTTVDNYTSLIEITGMTDGDVVYVLDVEDTTYPPSEYGNKLYQYDEETDAWISQDDVGGWVAQDTFDNYGAIYVYDEVSTTIGRGVKGSKSTVQTDTTDLVLKAIADMKASRMLIDGTNSAITELTFVDNGNEYKLSYNPNNGTIDLSLGSGVTLQIGQEQLAYVKNITHATEDKSLSAGQPVTLQDTTGQRPQPLPIDPSNDDSARGTVGIVTSEGGIADNGMGYVATFGMVRELDTSAYTQGELVYVGTDGLLTSTKPEPPNNVIEIGLVINSEGNNKGIIFVNPRIRDKVINLSDTVITNLTAGEVLLAQSDGTFKNTDTVPNHYTKQEALDLFVDQQEIEDANTAISNLDTRVTANEGAIDTNATDIGTLRLDTDANETDITLLLNALDLDTGGNV